MLLILLLFSTYIVQASENGDKDKIIADAFEKKDVLLAAGKYQDALELANKILALKPGSEVAAAAFYMRGESYANLGNYDEAIKDFNRALELDPSNLEKLPPLYFNIGTRI